MSDRRAEAERISRKAAEAAERAEAAQQAAKSSQYERLQNNVRRTINALFLTMATLWVLGLGVILLWKWGHYP